MTVLNRITMAAAAALALTVSGPVSAGVTWDVAIPWGASEFHTQNAMKFAEAVNKATNGEVTMVIHPGGSLGVKANESLRAVEDGSVPMAEFALFQNVGELPILGIESIPFLVKDYAELRVMHELVRPIWERELLKRNQKAFYMVPWPSQNFFTRKPAETLADLKGVRMRTYDKNSAEMVSRIGMVALQMNSPDIVPALASGKLDAVMTSGTTAAAQKYWEFLNHTYNTNHLWASNALVVNLESWNALPADQKAKIDAIAKKMEPGFWTISEGEHGKRMKQLMDNGMTVSAPSAELSSAMRKATETMAAEFGKKIPDAAAVIAEFKKRTGK